MEPFGNDGRTINKAANPFTAEFAYRLPS